MIGGGALVEWEPGYGNMLTGSWPGDDSGSWQASSKDHGAPSPAVLKIWCIEARVKRREVYVARATNAIHTGQIAAHAVLPEEYVLVGGGGRAFLQEDDAGCLLTQSYPTADNVDGWTAAAADHMAQSPVVVEAHAVGIHRDFLESHKLRVVRVKSKKPQRAAHPQWRVNMSSLFVGRKRGVVTCGGGLPDSSRTFLWETYPDEEEAGKATGWVAASKDHFVSAPTHLTTFGIAIVPV